MIVTDAMVYIFEHVYQETKEQRFSHRIAIRRALEALPDTAAPVVIQVPANDDADRFDFYTEIDNFGEYNA